MTAFHPHLLDRRLGTARTTVWIVLGVLVMSFFRTQILGHGKYQLQSETNRLRPIPLPAPRGVIYDRNGHVMAENVPGYTVSLLPGPEANLRSTLARIASIANIDSAAIERVLQRVRRAPYQPALVLGDAPFKVVSALEERRVAIPGLLIQSEPKRYYPDTGVVAHLLGYVGEVTEGERATSRFAMVRLGGLVGKDGLEREYDDTLRGSEGVRFVEVSARGQMVREAEAAANLAPVPGADLHTTIDLDLQRYIAKNFPPGQRGAVLALNPNTGEILALYSAPGFDPNAFVGGVSAPYWRSLNESAAHPLLDRVIQARYPPGSTWKLAVAAMALKRGIVGPRSHMPIPCRGGLQYGNRFFRCWDAHGHGDLTLTEAIAQSCDVYFYQLGIKLGVNSILEDANAWGFRGRTGIDLPSEIPSEFPTGPEYYDRLYGARRWTSAVALNLAIGQGENAQTLVQMVRLFQQLASDGRIRTPFVVRATTSPATENMSLDLNADQLATLRRAMIAVVEQGTARGSRLANLTIAGKTGTAQNPHGLSHGWFIGFAPADKPEIVVGAIIEFARHGTAVAPLVSRAIAHYLGIDEQTAATLKVTVPNDSAPAPFQIPMLLPDSAPLQLRLPQIRPVPPTQPPPPPPTDSAVARPPAR
ncbi:MAG TPA: penicillin-binding protein 2 [Gemmatimonadales bacterium]|nr:penicillin-binding protein 2 [Gemmatimonadales bacterium]